MRTIKTRKTVRDVKILDKSVNLSKRMRDVFIRTKESAEETQSPRGVSPSDYAIDSVQDTAQRAAGDVLRRVTRETKDRVKDARQHSKERSYATAADQKHGAGQAKAPARHSIPRSPQESAVSTDYITTKKTVVNLNQLIPDNPHIKADEPTKAASRIRRESNETRTSARDTKYTLKQSRLKGRRALREVRRNEIINRQQTINESNINDIFTKGDSVAKTDAAHTTPKTDTARAAENDRMTAHSVESGSRPAVSSDHQLSTANYHLSTTNDGSPRTSTGIDQTSGVVRSDVDAPKSHRIRDTAKTTVRATRKSAKKIERSIKTARKSIKTTGKTTKTSMKTARQTAKAAQKTARATAKAAKTARVAAKQAQAAVKATAKTAVKVVKVAVKAVIAFTKAVIAAIKGLIAAIAAGGWAAVAIILVICMAAMIVGSAFGIFFSNDSATGGGLSLNQVISEINSGFQADIQAKIDELKARISYDEVEVYFEGDIEGDSDIPNNWSDVLTVYSVKSTRDGIDALIFDETRITALQDVFNSMNTVSIRYEIITEEIHVESDPDPDAPDSEEPATRTKITLVIYVKVTSLAYEQAAASYGFTERQKQIADEMMSPTYYSMFAALMGVEIYGGADLTHIISNLPPGEKGSAIVEAALTRLGHPYSQSLRGQKNYLDCSYLAWWSYKQAGVDIPSTSVAQAKYCYDNGYNIGKSELQPGDLIFWSKRSCKCGRWEEIHHTGIYIGDGKTIEASAGKGMVVIRELWGENGATWRIHSYARPQF